MMAKKKAKVMTPKPDPLPNKFDKSNYKSDMSDMVLTISKTKIDDILNDIGVTKEQALIYVRIQRSKILRAQTKCQHLFKT